MTRQKCKCYCSSENCAANRMSNRVQAATKFNNWCERNSSTQVNVCLHPEICKNSDESDESCDSYDLEKESNNVVKTKSRIKFRSCQNQARSSRYHLKCLENSKKKKKKRKAPKRKVIQSQNYLDHEKLHPKFKNECYCTYPKSKPFLPSKPLISQPVVRKIKKECKPSLEKVSTAHSVETLRKAKELLRNYSPESVFLKNLRNEATQTFHCKCKVCKFYDNLKYTEEREALEESYTDIKELSKQCKKISSMTYDKNKSQPSSSKESNNTEEQMKESNTDEVEISVTVEEEEKINENVIEEEKINAVNEIRKKNFFDTHSTEDLVKNVPNHTCVHEFELDEKNLPRPLNPDTYGISRCIQCQRPLKCFRDQVKNKCIKTCLIDFVEPIRTCNKTCNQYTDTKSLSDVKLNENGNNMQRQSETKEKLELLYRNVETSTDKKNLSDVTESEYNGLLNNAKTAYTKKQSQKKTVSKTEQLSETNQSSTTQQERQTRSTSKKPKSNTTTRVYPTPRHIHIPVTDEEIHLIYPNRLLSEIKRYTAEKIIPANTWALRYQKGINYLT